MQASKGHLPVTCCDILLQLHTVGTWEKFRHAAVDADGAGLLPRLSLGYGHGAWPRGGRVAMVLHGGRVGLGVVTGSDRVSPWAPLSMS